MFEPLKTNFNSINFRRMYIKNENLACDSKSAISDFYYSMQRPFFYVVAEIQNKNKNIIGYFF